MRGAKEVFQVDGKEPPEYPIFEYVPSEVMTHIPYARIPEDLKAALHMYGMMLTDPDSGRVMVSGGVKSGKTFFIGQLLMSLPEIAKNFGYSEYFPLAVIESEIEKAFSRGLETLDEYFLSVAEYLEIDVEQIIVVSNVPEIASQIGNSTLPVKVLFEATSPMFEAFFQQHNNGVIGGLTSWEVANCSQLFLPREDLIESVYQGQSARIQQQFGYRIQRKIIAKILDQILQFSKRDNIDEDEDIPVPPGILASAVRHFVRNYKHSPANVSGKERQKTCIEEAVLFYEEELRSNGVITSPQGQRFIVRTQDVSGMDALLGAVMDEIESFADHGSNSSEDTEEQEAPSEVAFQNFATLEKRLSDRIVGQPDAVEKVTNGLAIPAAGLNDPNKPLRTFFFAGPTGVGKTELSKTIAKELYTEEMNVIRLDMSEYSSKGSTSALFGSTPGYIGYTEEGGQLTKEVAAHPNSLIILDEVEKAEPTTWDAMLQVFDAGRMTTGGGKVVDFSKTIIIMTSNLGSDKLQSRPAGFGAVDTMRTREDIESIVRSSLKEYFRLEFINRIDNIVVFDQLDKNSARAVVKRELNTVMERVVGRGLTLNEPSVEIIDTILERSQFNTFGARDIQREVQRSVAAPIAKFILQSKTAKNFTLESSQGDFSVVSS